jgi:hypothetical protein
MSPLSSGLNKLSKISAWKVVTCWLYSCWCLDQLYLPWKRSRYVPPKHQQTFNLLHSSTYIPEEEVTWHSVVFLVWQLVDVFLFLLQSWRHSHVKKSQNNFLIPILCLLPLSHLFHCFHLGHFPLSFKFKIFFGFLSLFGLRICPYSLILLFIKTTCKIFVCKLSLFLCFLFSLLVFPSTILKCLHCHKGNEVGTEYAVSCYAISAIVSHSTITHVSCYANYCEIVWLCCNTVLQHSFLCHVGTVFIWLWIGCMFLISQTRIVHSARKY